MLDFIKDNPILCLVAFLLVVSPSFLFGAVQVIAVVVLAIIIMAVVGMLSLKWKVSKMQKEAQQSQGFNSQTKDQTTKIYSNQSGKKVADDVGDYVEFEEIKDK